MVNLKTVEDLKQLPEADLVVNHICDRKRKGLYSLVLIAGLPGSGKSSQCCRLGELVSEKLTGVNSFKASNITDNFLGFVKFVKDANPEDVNIIVVEEISVLFPSRRAMSGENVDLAKILDTCRKKQVIIFANAPIWTSIDSHMRSMANVYLQAIKVYKKAGLVFSKCYKLQTDPRTGKTYTHNFKRGAKDVNRMYTLAPNAEVWAEYESKKDSFLEMIYSKAEARAVERKKKDEKLLQHLTPKSAEGLTPRELAIYDAYKAKGKNQTEIAKEMNLTQATISRIYKQIVKKLQDMPQK